MAHNRGSCRPGADVHQRRLRGKLIQEQPSLGLIVNFVSAILSESVKVAVAEPSPPELQALGASVNDGVANIPFTSKSELATTLTALQGAGFLFADEPAGWPPAAVFQQLRDESLVSGSIRTVSWTGPEQPVFGEV